MGKANFQRRRAGDGELGSFVTLIYLTPDQRLGRNLEISFFSPVSPPRFVFVAPSRLEGLIVRGFKVEPQWRSRAARLLTAALLSLRSES